MLYQLQVPQGEKIKQSTVSLESIHPTVITSLITTRLHHQIEVYQNSFQSSWIDSLEK